MLFKKFNKSCFSQKEFQNDAQNLQQENQNGAP
jgi:hypothetical protein